MVPVWLLLMFVACGLLTLVLSWVAKLLFPKFRSGEFKPGPHRSDLPASGREIKTIELPLVGGPAITLAIIATGIGAGLFFKLSSEQWTLLLIGLGATFGFMVVGFIDDWCKVHANEGISERAKFAGVLFVSMAAALFYYLLTQHGREPYSPYLDILRPIFDLPFTAMLGKPH